MEKKNKNNYNDYKKYYYRFNSNKIKPKENNININNKELNKNKKIEISNIKNENINKKPQIKNEIIQENHNNKINNIDLNSNENIINDNNNIYNNPEFEQIIKLKLENKLLKKKIETNDKLINEFRQRCKEQKLVMDEIIRKTDNIKKFISESGVKKNKQKEKEQDKFEEQLAIAAVEEQIMKELYPNNTDQTTMDKIFKENNKKESNKLKDKIMKIPQIYYKKNEFDNFECLICIDEFKENELLKQLKCGHIFHKECLSQWLLNNDNCPGCNKIC